MADLLHDAVDLDSFEQLIGSTPAAIVHFWASWCEPCKHLDTILAQLASENKEAKFIRVEAEEVADVSEKYDVSAVPFFLFFMNGTPVDRLEGANPAELSKKVALHLKVTGSANDNLATPPPRILETPPSKGDLTAKLSALVKSRPVLLFMKGSPQAPRCGFSSKVVAALKDENVPFGSFDILGDEEVRQGMKTFSNWPTFPQLYVNGELVGGCDIVLEMHESGELRDLLQKEGVAPVVDKATTSETKVTDSEMVQDKGVVGEGKGR